MPVPNSESSVSFDKNRFNTTLWTVILDARDPASPDVDASLEKLCRTYWPAIYAYVRRQGRSRSDAADLTQSYFARFLQKQFLKDVDRSKGKFRSFLLTSLNHFLADEWRRDHAQKRGGSQPVLSLDIDGWEANFAHELKSDVTPAKLFERRWALALFEEALSRLRDGFAISGKEREFDLLKEFLGQSSTGGSYSNVAEELGLEENTVAVRVHRLRRRYALLVREEVARTVVDTDEIDTELNHLLNVICG